MWPVRHQIYSHFPSLRASLPIDQFQVILLCDQSFCPRDLALASRTPHEGLGLGLGWQGRGLGLERKVLALALLRPRPRLFPQDPGQMVAVRVCSSHTHGVTWQSAIFCLGMLHRSARELDAGCKIIPSLWSARCCLMPMHLVHTAYSSCSRRYNYTCAAAISVSNWPTAHQFSRTAV